MDPFAGRFLLESLVTPAIVSSLIIFPTRWLSRRVSLFLSCLAILAAMIVTYVMIFGWPTSLVIGARQKIYLLTTVSILLCLGSSRTVLFRWLAINLILGLLWISWPIISQGRFDAVLVVLPITFGLWVYHQTLSTAEATVRSGTMLALVGVGLSMIALLGRTLSFSQLSLALASSLIGILMLGPRPPQPLPITVAATALSAILAALILYSDASLPAILVLCSSLASPMLARHLCSRFAIQDRYGMWRLVATVLLVVAIVIAWIDAGAVSVYEGVQHDGAVFQWFG